MSSTERESLLDVRSAPPTLSPRSYGSVPLVNVMNPSLAADASPSYAFPPSTQERPPLSDQPEVAPSEPPPRDPTSLGDPAEVRSRSGKQKATDASRVGPRAKLTLPRVAFELENKGSVARDHLASERTFLAWLRTSLALASIGIAITQLFRLPASTTGTPTNQTPSTSAQAAEINAALQPLISAYPELAGLQSILQAQQVEVAEAVAKIENSTRYRHLGKPIGGTLIALALVFLFIGTHRYFTVQAALMRTPVSMFPPSRRSVAFSGFCVGALVIAAFAAVLATR